MKWTGDPGVNTQLPSRSSLSLFRTAASAVVPTKWVYRNVSRTAAFSFSPFFDDDDWPLEFAVFRRIDQIIIAPRCRPQERPHLIKRQEVLLIMD